MTGQWGLMRREVNRQRGEKPYRLLAQAGTLHLRTGTGTSDPKGWSLLAARKACGPSVLATGHPSDMLQSQ